MLARAVNILEGISERSWLFSKGISKTPPVPCALVTVVLLFKVIYDEFWLMLLSQQHFLET